eukprot:scaffold74617_cov34-Tisochrysis_lutea.AAC.4
MEHSPNCPARRVLRSAAGAPRVYSTSLLLAYVALVDAPGQVETDANLPSARALGLRLEQRATTSPRLTTCDL